MLEPIRRARLDLTPYCVSIDEIKEWFINRQVKGVHVYRDAYDETGQINNHVVQNNRKFLQSSTAVKNQGRCWLRHNLIGDIG